jgi:hypothetical protein
MLQEQDHRRETAHSCKLIGKADDGRWNKEERKWKKGIGRSLFSG